MVVIIPDDEIRAIGLSGDQIRILTDLIGQQPHNAYEFYEDIDKILKDALQKDGE